MSDKLTTRIATLARLVASARDLSQIDKYFHAQLAQDPAFLAEGARAVHNPLTQIVKGVARAYGCELQGEGVLVHVPRFSLWHGSFGALVGSVAIVLYFDDQHRGAVTFGKLSDPNTHHIRFSLPEGARDPDLAVDGLELVSAGPANRRGSA